ncbi:thrombospondin type 3 repeat-containing protein [Patescibacteria group bacterium AH-259-L07]|nr:thrombospondin type 3 repeat-containing protein [Patescibacteria group bacterium AH-259-L07]
MPEEEKKLPKEPEDIFAEAEVAPPPKSEARPPTTPPAPAVPEKKPAPPPQPTKAKKTVNTKKVVKIAIVVIVILVVGLVIFYGVNTLITKKTSGITPTTEPAAPEGGEPRPDISGREPSPETIDSDADGLSDAKERELGTNRNSPDSDNDGLFDKEEVDVYLTDPLESDTDTDGILDGEEVKQGTDPNDPNPGALLLDLQKEIKKLK